jgi:hypothetical protein
MLFFFNLTAMGQRPGQKKQKPFIQALGLNQIITNLRDERQIIQWPILYNQHFFSIP